jgi:tetratricopeptide (TPR) repeat protein
MKSRRQEHDLTVKGLRQQQAAAAKELVRLRNNAQAAGVTLPEQAITAADSKVGGSPEKAADEADSTDSNSAAHEASKFGASRLTTSMSATQAEAAAKAAAGCGGAGAGSSSGSGDRNLAAEQREIEALSNTVDNYQNAVEKAWADVQSLEDKRQQVDRSYQESQEEVERLDREREDMEATLHEVASDLGRLALLYRTQGQAPHAVPLYMTALAIYEKTLGPDHPEVAKDLVNLGNAFCDQNQHEEAVPLYLRALAIDQAALGDDHPEVAMDLSNLGIVYRVQVAS